MKFADDDVMTLLYSDRRLIVVDNDEAVEIVRGAASEDEVRLVTVQATPTVVPGATLGGAVAGAVASAVASAAVNAAVQLWRARKKADKANLPYLILTTSQSANLRFPIGHPLKGVVYVGDPGVAGNYYPVANFHRVLFDGKVSEAIRLLRSLGATEISIEYLEGFDRGAGVDLSSGVATGGVHRTNKASAGAKTTMQLSPSLPAHIPKDLVWFRSEPLWQEVANARLESGLRNFTLDVNYTDDFGIDARLKAKIEGVGLELGGKFTEHQETTWKLSGTFSEQALPNAIQ